MVLHDISNDSKFVKVSTTPFSTKWFLEGNLYVVDVVSIPCSTKEFITKPQDQDVLDHFLSKIMIDTENLILMPVWLQCLLQLSGAS